MHEKDLAIAMCGFLREALADRAAGSEDPDKEWMPSEMLDHLEVFPSRTKVVSYESAGVMSSAPGFVIRVGDREFQVTVVRSK